MVRLTSFSLTQSAFEKCMRLHSKHSQMIFLCLMHTQIHINCALRFSTHANLNFIKPKLMPRFYCKCNKCCNETFFSLLTFQIGNLKVRMNGFFKYFFIRVLWLKNKPIDERENWPNDTLNICHSVFDRLFYIHVWSKWIFRRCYMAVGGN